MKNTIILFVLILSGYAFSQQSAKFYIEIPDEANIPVVTQKKGNQLSLSFSDTILNNFLQNYEIYRFEEAFPDARTPKLQTVYYVECNNENLKDILVQNYPSYFPHSEEVPEVHLLYTPNDYVHSGDVFNAKNLDLINVKEAWNYSKGNPNFIIGISDSPIMTAHEDLAGKTTTLYSSPADSHGTGSAGVAAANTDNNIGIAGVGFNSSILGAGTGVSQLLQLSNNGVRVVNASWYSYCNDTGVFDPNSYDQLAINEIHENGTVIVIAAGNGVQTGSGPGSNPCANPEKFFFPASYDHVISVSGVGIMDIGYIDPVTGDEKNWRDRVERVHDIPYYRTQTNSKVDIRAPGYDNWSTTVPSATNGYSHYGKYGGTSAAAPHVAGGVSLMLTANACLNPDEVKSLLKLTSVKLDTISSNTPYIGKLGAGRMDIGKATKAAWQMSSANGGEVLLINRTFKEWNFVLLNSPEYIRMKNEEFIENANIEFRAKKGITLDINTLLIPGSGKSHYLYIENTNTCFSFNPLSKQKNAGKKILPDDEMKDFKIYPNPAKDYISIFTKEDIQKIEILDTSGKLIKTFFSSKSINIQDIAKGNYMIKIYGKTKIVTKKIIKI